MSDGGQPVLPLGTVAAEVLAGRLASPVAASATIRSAAALVAAVPVPLASDPDVYGALQKLAATVDSVIGTVDEDSRYRHLIGDQTATAGAGG